MCGITFIISRNDNNVINEILLSLNIIQNRGYDSMGICYFNKENNKYDIIKRASLINNDCYDNLANYINEKNIISNVALGHTRWATHGSKTENNAHPHISQNGNIILVHNGIINNFLTIKIDLINKGYCFYGDTDTEIIANLIEYNWLETKDMEIAIKKTLNIIEGTWAFIIINTNEINKYYITRKGSPLLFGINDNYIISTSESNGFIGLVDSYITINNDQIFKVENNDYKIINLYESLSNKSYTIDKIEPIVTTCAPYKHWMHKEIMEQSETIKKAYNYGGRIDNNKIKLGGLENIKLFINYVEYIIIIGCGTSYNAGLLAEKYFKNNKRFINVICYNACEFNEKDIPNVKNNQQILCIFLSQSGETIDVYKSLEICKNNNCITLGVINRVDSLIAREVNCGVYLNAGSEISVASTKSFTSMIIVLSLIEMWININYNSILKINNLNYLSKTIEEILYKGEFRSQIDDIKDIIINNNINNIFILGKNLLYPIALEISLKIKEVCYIHAEGFSSGSLKHGPFALLDKTNLTILLIDYNDKINYKSLVSTYIEISSRDTNIIVVTNNENVIRDLNIKNNYLLLYNLEYYNEIIFVIALQYLAYVISTSKNINPDKPRNLSKVVTVE